MTEAAVEQKSYISDRGKERMLRLASRMDKVVRAHFNINSWYDTRPATGGLARSFAETDVVEAPLPQEYEGSSDSRFSRVDYRGVETGHTNVKVKRVLNEGFCGSTACVLGHAGLIKEFNKEGLFIYANWRGLGEMGGVAYLDGDGIIHDGIAAGVLFFEIPRTHANVLFYGDDHIVALKLYGNVNYQGEITPQIVANALREYVATSGQNIETLFAERKAELLAEEARIVARYNDGEE